MKVNTPQELLRVIDNSRTRQDGPIDEDALMQQLVMFVTKRDHEIWQAGYEAGKKTWQWLSGCDTTKSKS